MSSINLLNAIQLKLHRYVDIHENILRFYGLKDGKYY